MKWRYLWSFNASLKNVNVWWQVSTTTSFHTLARTTMNLATFNQLQRDLRAVANVEFVERSMGAAANPAALRESECCS